jgi:ferredoxin
MSSSILSVSSSIACAKLDYRRGGGSRLTCRQARLIAKSNRRFAVAVYAHTVQLEHSGGFTTLEVPQDESILSVAIDAGLDVPHDCKLGVCMNCAARLVSGEVDQSAGMLSDDVKEKGYVLLCCALPKGDVEIKVIEEEELLAEVMQS